MKNSIKPSLVFLPGWGMKASIWHRCSSQLNNTQLVDLPALNQEQDVNFAVTQLAKTIREGSIIIAWSLSGLLAIALCHQFPHKCAKLILVNSSPFFSAAPDWAGISPVVAKRFLQKATANLECSLNQFIKLVAYPDTANVEFITPHISKDYLLIYLNLLFITDYRQLFQQLTLPLFCLFGENDAIVPVGLSHQLKDLNNNVTSKIMPHAGHIPFISHQKEFCTILAAILNETT